MRRGILATFTRGFSAGQSRSTSSSTISIWPTYFLRFGMLVTRRIKRRACFRRDGRSSNRWGKERPLLMGAVTTGAFRACGLAVGLAGLATPARMGVARSSEPPPVTSRRRGTTSVSKAVTRTAPKDGEGAGRAAIPTALRRANGPPVSRGALMLEAISNMKFLHAIPIEQDVAMQKGPKTKPSRVSAVANSFTWNALRVFMR
jgi:hypothetical protein